MLESARDLALHGALWRPDDGGQMQDVRRSLYKCEPAITVEVVKMSPDTMSVRKRNSKSFWTLRRMRAHGALSGRAFPWTGQQDSVGFEAIGDSSRNTGWVTGRSGTTGHPFTRIRGCSEPFPTTTCLTARSFPSKKRCRAVGLKGQRRSLSAKRQVRLHPHGSGDGGAVRAPRGPAVADPRDVHFDRHAHQQVGRPAVQARGLGRRHHPDCATPLPRRRAQ